MGNKHLKSFYVVVEGFSDVFVFLSGVEADLTIIATRAGSCGRSRSRFLTGKCNGSFSIRHLCVLSRNLTMSFYFLDVSQCQKQSVSLLITVDQELH